MTPTDPVASLLTERLEAPLAPLERLPRGLWLGTLAHSHGPLVPRLEAVERLRAALLAGRPPDPGAPWPRPPLARAVAAAFAALDLPRSCAGDEPLVDLVLRSLLWHLDRIPDLVDRGATVAAAEALAVEAFAADWSERCGELRELVDVLGPLGDLLESTRWDLLRGLLRSSGWQEVVRIRRLVERIPELVRVIRQLGRARETEHPDESRRVTVEVMERGTALRRERRTTRVPDLPGETRGVRRSSRVARMLPSEAMLLAHPRLRLVWHARHAERTLLTYEDDDRLEDVVLREVPVWRRSARRAAGRRLELGPMLVCVDTSGSMQGGAELVAKAVVLEAVRAAHAQRRACHVFAFSGPGEVVEMPLALDAGGLERLTRFMGQSFGGGTDIGAPLERALAMLDDEAWQLADLLLASDGEFGATPEVAAAVARAKASRGLRVQGVLIGDRETIGMLELADDVFWVRDWRRLGGSDAASPVPSKGLTAAYFPGALRTAGAPPAASAGGAARARGGEAAGDEEDGA
ncbi:MAG TPA: VWA domain-containing protein [Anaeromyxobacter sp.]|nr:VWA domain-containing protein [Anaeromyxobacter sp.]